VLERKWVCPLTRETSPVAPWSSRIGYGALSLRTLRHSGLNLVPAPASNETAPLARSFGHVDAPLLGLQVVRSRGRQMKFLAPGTNFLALCTPREVRQLQPFGGRACAGASAPRRSSPSIGGDDIDYSCGWQSVVSLRPGLSTRAEEVRTENHRTFPDRGVEAADFRWHQSGSSKTPGVASRCVPREERKEPTPTEVTQPFRSRLALQSPACPSQPTVRLRGPKRSGTVLSFDDASHREAHRQASARGRHRAWMPP